MPFQPSCDKGFQNLIVFHVEKEISFIACLLAQEIKTVLVFPKPHMYHTSNIHTFNAKRTLGQNLDRGLYKPF